MSLMLIVAIPEPGTPGAPRALFFDNTPEGHAHAAAWLEREDRPGWGVFESLNPLADNIDFDQALTDMLVANGFPATRRDVP